MTTWQASSLTDLRARLAKAKPGDIIECPGGRTFRPRIPIVIPQGVVVRQMMTNVIDEAGNHD